MKKTIALIASVILVLIIVSCTTLSEEARFVTIQEWLDAKGECGDCMLLLKIQEVLNPVLAIGADDTGTINLYSGGENSIIIEFGNEERLLTGYWMVIGNPRYNEYEGTIEMADWALLRTIPDTQSIQFNAEIIAKTEEIQALHTELEQYAEQMAEADAYITEQAAQIDALNAENAEKMDWIEQLRAESTEKSTWIEELRAENADQAARIEELKELVEYYKNSFYPGPGTSWQAIINELKVRIEQLEAELAERLECIAAMEVEIEKLNCRIAELEAVTGEQN